MDAKRGRTLGVVSIKGGVGKTTVVANLGASLASHYGKSVLVVDTNVRAPNLGVHLDLMYPQASLYDVLAGDAEISEAIYPHPTGMHVIPSPFGFGEASSRGLARDLRSIAWHYDFVILDSTPFAGEDLLSTVEASDELIIVTTLDMPSISTVIKLMDLSRRRDTKILGIVANRVRRKNFELDPEIIKTITGLDIIVRIPEDQRVLEAVSIRKPVVAYAPHSRSGQEFRRLAAILSGMEYRGSRISFVHRMFYVGKLDRAREHDIRERINVLEGALRQTP
ncbi:MAG: AAA family ATPase [Candidatus Altiarchaeota archaeon]|nr:AAA family ATPase [Candidatus Altiarchaeota archaeon]